MRSNLSFLFTALALPLALACGDASAPNAPTASELVIEDVSEAEILADLDLDDLTEEQRAALRAAIHEAHLAIMEIRRAFNAGEITLEEARARARAVHQALIATLSTILTPEQLEDFLRPPIGPHPPGLDLTEEQRAQIMALRQDLAAFVHSLAEQVHSGEITGEEARGQFFAALRRFHAAVCAILTPEQQANSPFCRAAGG